MKNYIQYLNLYIIDDWKYEDDMCISQKANLVINLVEDQDMFILSIHTINRMMNEVEVVKSIKNWYKIDTNYMQVWYKFHTKQIQPYVIKGIGL